MRRIRIIALGGTIAMRRAGQGLEPALSGDGLFGFLDAAQLGVDIDWDDFSNIPSANIRFDSLIKLASDIDQLHAEGYSGVVVTQGTDTLEETAFAVELLLKSAINVAFTGAMRGASHISPDGPANILAALGFLAGTEASSEVVVVLNDEIHAARHALKAHATSLGAFTSGDVGLRGRLHEGRFRGLNPPAAPLPKLSVRQSARTPRVLLATICLDQDGSLFDHAAALGIDGWVIAAVGAGHVPATLVGRLEALAKGAPVVLCSRTGFGGICEETYGYPGGEIDLLDRGLAPGKSLTALKARVLLTLLMMERPERIAERFVEIARRC